MSKRQQTMADGGSAALPEAQDDAAQRRRANVQINQVVTVEAPSLIDVADYFDEKAAELESEHGGAASGRGAGGKAKMQGKAQGYREAAEFLRSVRLTG